MESQAVKRKENFIGKLPWYYLMPVCAGVIGLIHIIVTVMSEKYLYCDGSNYLMSVVSKGAFEVYPLGRAGFDYLVQWPAVLAARMGCTSLKTLGMLYGLGLSLWPALWFVASILVCCYKRKQLLAYIVFLLDTSVLLVWGFFVQLESVMGLMHFVLLLLLILLGEREGTVNKVMLGYLMIGSLLCYHLNEYYTFWSLVLAAALLVKSRDVLHILLAVWHGFIAVSSYLSISARGEAPSVGEALLGFLRHKFLVVVVLLLLAHVGCILLGKVLAKKEQAFEFLLSQLASLMASVYVLFVGGYILLRTHHIANFGTGARFVLFAGGGILGIALVFVWMKTRGVQELKEVAGFRWLILMQTILLCFFLVKSGVQFYDFDTVLYESCMEEARLGNELLLEEENPLPKEEILSYYYWAWTMPPQSILVQGIRGEKQIGCVAVGDGFYEYDGGNASYPDLSRYGIIYEGSKER